MAVKEMTQNREMDTALKLLQFYKLFSTDDANSDSKSVEETKGIRAAVQKKAGTL